jgi:hypothetical protein
VAQDCNGDVDRAMASFAAPSMPYSNFVTPSATLDNVKSNPGRDPAAKVEVRVTKAAAFPLLVSALPGLMHRPMPTSPAGTDTSPDKPRRSEADRIEPATARPLPRPTAQPVQTMSRREQALPRGQTGTTNLPAVFGLAPGQTNYTPAPLPRVAKGGTSIATMFDTLQTNSRSSAEGQPEASSGLQDVFSRL